MSYTETAVSVLGTAGLTVIVKLASLPAAICCCFGATMVVVAMGVGGGVGGVEIITSSKGLDVLPLKGEAVSGIYVAVMTSVPSGKAGIEFTPVGSV